MTRVTGRNRVRCQCDRCTAARQARQAIDAGQLVLGMIAITAAVVLLCFLAAAVS